MKSDLNTTGNDLERRLVSYGVYIITISIEIHRNYTREPSKISIDPPWNLSGIKLNGSNEIFGSNSKNCPQRAA
jgi:hypothetical protein